MIHQSMNERTDQMDVPLLLQADLVELHIVWCRTPNLWNRALLNPIPPSTPSIFLILTALIHHHAHTHKHTLIIYSMYCTFVCAYLRIVCTSCWDRVSVRSAWGDAALRSQDRCWASFSFYGDTDTNPNISQIAPWQNFRTLNGGKFCDAMLWYVNLD